MHVHIVSAMICSSLCALMLKNVPNELIDSQNNNGNLQQTQITSNAKIKWEFSVKWESVVLWHFLRFRNFNSFSRSFIVVTHPFVCSMRRHFSVFSMFCVLCTCKSAEHSMSAHSVQPFFCWSYYSLFLRQINSTDVGYFPLACVSFIACE